MKLLIATSQFFGVYDGGRVARIHRGAGVYSGISWNDQHVFVSALDNAGVWDFSNRDGEVAKESILVFDRDAQLVDRIATKTFDMHLIHWCAKRGALLACDTGTDWIVQIDARGPKPVWTPAMDPPPLPERVVGKHHINSVWTDARGAMWVLLCYAHPEHGKLVKLNGDLAVDVVLSLPSESHTAYAHRTVNACASHDESLWQHNRHTGSTLITPLGAGYLRGIAEVSTALYIGGGARGSRRVRHYGPGTMVRLEDGDITRTRVDGSGQIYCVRAIGPDVAHQGTWGPPCPFRADAIDERLHRR